MDLGRQKGRRSLEGRGGSEAEGFGACVDGKQGKWTGMCGSPKRIPVNTNDSTFADGFGSQALDSAVCIRQMVAVRPRYRLQNHRLYSIACTPFVSDTLVHKRVPSVLRWRLRRDWGTVPPKKFEVGNGPSIRPLPIF